MKEPAGSHDKGLEMAPAAERLATDHAGFSTPELLDAFFETAVDLLCIADLAGRFRRLNAEWTRTLGYPLDELIGRPFLELVHADDQAPTVEAVSELAAGKTVAGFVNRYRCRDGSYRFIEWRSAPLGSNLIAAAARDVTETRNVQERLRESEAELRRTHMMVRLGHWRLDARALVVSCSEEVLRIFELPSPQFSFESYLEAVRDDDRERVREANRRALDEGRPYDIEYVVRFSDGMERYVRSIAQPVFDADGAVTAVVGTVQDLTERHEAEAERRRFEAQIQQVQKLESLGVLAGGIAHDFNNMLMAIVGNAELALQDLESASPARPMLDAIVGVSERAADLCRQMLAYSGRGRLLVQPLDLSKTIEGIRHVLAISASKRGELRYRLAAALPSIQADAAQMRQVVVNLVTNASEALGDQGGAISVITRGVQADRSFLDSVGLSRLPEGRYVLLQVEDNGCGMDDTTQARCFEPFFTTKFTGRGLGLAAVHGIVQSHGGGIAVRSEPRKGSVFTVLLPAVSDAAEPRRGEDARPGAWRGSGLVLLADDEEAVRMVGRSLLQRLGFDVILAADGEEAVQLFRTRHDRLRCVLLDLTMPHLDGRHALAELRALDSKVPVVLCSGYSEQDATGLAGPDADGFVQKPYRLASLVEVLKRVLEKP